jgi:hypothetical protein
MKLIIPLVLSFLIGIIAAFRPYSIGYDTPLYIEVLNSYWTDGTSQFPDLIFSNYAKIFTFIFPNNSVSERIYLVSISLLQSILLFKILIKKNIFESILISLGFGPLIFFDILRQGTAMLMIANYIIAPTKYNYLILGLLSHFNSIVVFINFNLFKRYKITFPILIFVLLSIHFNSEELYNRINFYLADTDYLNDRDIFGRFIDKISIQNILVFVSMAFFFYTKKINFNNISVLTLLYFISIPYPIIFRLYFFYFFIIFCNMKLDFSDYRISNVANNILLSFLILNFSNKTNFFINS